MAIQDKKKRKLLADELSKDIAQHCEIRAIPQDMFLNIWNLYVSEQARKIDLEYADCSTIVFAQEIKKARYQEDHRLNFDGILTFNERQIGRAHV